MLKFSAGGFRNFTRIAASDPTMWRDVFLTNKDAVLEMLGTFNEDLSQLTRAIRRGDGEALFAHFTRTRAIRRGIVQIGQEPPAPDLAGRIPTCRSRRCRGLTPPRMKAEHDPAKWKPVLRKEHAPLNLPERQSLQFEAIAL